MHEEDGPDINKWLKETLFDYHQGPFIMQAYRENEGIEIFKNN
jgi:hypothetical protein